jgi:hypothetical protein
MNRGLEMKEKYTARSNHNEGQLTMSLQGRGELVKVEGEKAER